MRTSASVPASNRILAKLAMDEYRRLQPSLEPVTLRVNQVLYRPGEVVQHIYFPHNAVASLLFHADERRTVEVAMEGNEGAVGLAVYLGGIDSCNLSIVRNAGTAMRLDVGALARCNDQCSQLRTMLHRYAHALLTQIAQSGVCHRFHTMDARLARWLLMTRDRVGSNELYATQEFIAHLLGVRRSSVTAAANGFHKQKIIDYRRGRIEIIDQSGLRSACCDCYDLMKQQYDSFLS